MRPKPFAPIPASLPATVPFIGPETLQRRRGAAFDARLGANENGFGPSPAAIAAAAALVPRFNAITSTELLVRSCGLLCTSGAPYFSGLSKEAIAW